MGPSHLAVSAARFAERARRAPGYARRRWRRLRARLPLSSARQTPPVSSETRPGTPDLRTIELRDRDRRVWRAACAPHVGDLSLDRAQARHLLLNSGAFDAAWYLDVHQDRLPSATDPASAERVAVDHYLDRGWREGLAPSAWVDVDEVAARIGTSDEEPVSLLEALRERLDVVELQRRLDRDRPAGVPRDDTALRWRDLVDGQLPHEPTFVLYRILGNDLPPRHDVGQSERNLRFLLEHEPALPGCERRYVVNRIVDPDVERRLLEILEAHDAQVLHLPFDRHAYRRIGWRVSDFTRPGMLYGTTHDGLPEVNRARVIDHAFHDKNLYVMHNNGARNAALEDGRSRARWVLPFDGNCFFTATAWDELRAAVEAAPHRRYLVVPMARVNDNEQLLSADTPDPPIEEPQIAFRCDAPETFHPDARYGRRPKVELLRRLGVPGPWDQWPDEGWEPNLGQPCAEAGEYLTAGWVARLASGRPALEADASGRMISRMVAIRTALTEVDEQVLRERLRAEDPVFHDAQVLEGQRAAGTVGGRDLQAEVQAERARWAEREGADPAGAVPIVLDTFTGVLLEDPATVQRAADRLARAAGGAAGKDGPFTSSEPWQIVRLLDAARCLRDRGVLEPATVTHLRSLVDAHAATLVDQRISGSRRRALDTAGTWFEVEHLACAAYLDDTTLLLEGLRRVAGRLHDQFVVLPEKGVRWRHRVAAVPNLLAWGMLLRAVDRWGITLCDPASSAGERHRALAAKAADHLPTLPTALLVAPSGEQGPDASHERTPAPSPSSRVDGMPSEVPPFWWAGLLAP